MSIYLVLYRDGKNDRNDFDRMELEERFSMYNREISNSVLDGGSSVLSGKEITREGNPCALGDNHVTRYMMLEAEDIDQAIELSKGAPALNKGGHAEVYELSMSSY